MNAIMKELYQIAADDLENNLLKWWIDHSVDNENGGFYGQIDDQDRVIKGASKFITLNARLLWTFSAAFRVLQKPIYLEMANRAYAYLIRCFHDPRHGGFIARVDCEGRPLDENKYVYGNAFALYGISEYVRATKKREALVYAEEVVKCLEDHIFDPIYGGYLDEYADPSWAINTWIRGEKRAPTDVKNLNNHLHLIEAYTCLFRVHATPYLRAKLRQQLHVMLNRFVNKDSHHLHYFLTRDWLPTSYTISFGHDIEASWLMLEAAAVLGEPESLRATKDVSINMARAALDEAFRSDGAFLSIYASTQGQTSQALSWWEQNEAVVGFINAWEHTNEPHFLEAARKCLRYSLERFVDHENGGWHPELTLGGQVLHRLNKLDGAVCPYHNGRMSLEIIERYQKLALRASL